MGPLMALMGALMGPKMVLMGPKMVLMGPKTALMGICLSGRTGMFSNNFSFFKKNQQNKQTKKKITFFLKFAIGIYWA
jgi:hypothetical protein